MKQREKSREIRGMISGFPKLCIKVVSFGFCGFRVERRRRRRDE